MASGTQLDPETFETFRGWRVNRHRYAREWKERTGGKVVGYFCTYAPEELMVAAGILPVRILGSHDPRDATEPHPVAMHCPFCRDCLAEGLRGRYDYLDGIMVAQPCHHIRQASAGWEKHVPVEYSYYLPMPHHVQGPHATTLLARELGLFKESLEQWTGDPITEEDLEAGIEACNRSREMLWEAYRLRRGATPPYTGEEALEMVLSSQMVDKREHVAALEALMPRLAVRNVERPTGARLMILGSENDDIAFTAMVESCGATFVVDDDCAGTRYFWNNVERNGNALESIADRYLNRVPCPTEDWPERSRVEHALELAKEYGVQGALVVRHKACDPQVLEIPALTRAFDDAGIRTLLLEYDAGVPVDRFKARVEAFLETLGPGADGE